MSPLQIYKEKIAAGEIQHDFAQEQALQALERLHDGLLSLVDGQQRGLLSKLNPFSKNAAFEGAKGVYMYGGVGRGKSMLMDLFFSTIPEGLTKRRVHFHEFMIEAHDYIHQVRLREKSGKGADIALPDLAKKIAKGSRILCFDEFFVTDIADAMILGRLFTELFRQGVIVVATTNWEPDRLYEGGLQRDRVLPFIALLKETLEIVHLDSDTDYREQFFEEHSHNECCYFTPLNKNTHHKMDQLFAFLTHGEVPHGESFEVKGRSIQVQQAAGDAARFLFSDLCEKPLGAEDFLMLSKRYKTIFLENVPRLTYDRRNEAKRLMTLVDALYDNENNLIVSAAARPEKLYTGKDHAFEFERTISRLLEMQARKI